MVHMEFVQIHQHIYCPDDCMDLECDRMVHNLHHMVYLHGDIFLDLFDHRHDDMPIVQHHLHSHLIFLFDLKSKNEMK